MFLINSRFGQFSATWLCFRSKSLHKTRPTLSRSYGGRLQSSLASVLSSTLGYSPRLPVSVYGTGTRIFRRRPRLFLEAWTHQLVEPFELYSSRLSATRAFYSYAGHAYWVSGANPSRSPDYPSPSPLLLKFGGAGILTRCPSPTPFGLGLGPGLPWED